MLALRLVAPEVSSVTARGRREQEMLYTATFRSEQVWQSVGVRVNPLPVKYI